MPATSSPSSVRSGEKPSRRAFFEEIRPVRLANCDLKRFGSAHDGGYLMCANLLGQVQSAYSYGVGRKDDWACDICMATHVTVHQYDCFDPRRPTCPGGMFLFHDECVSGTGAEIDGRSFRRVIKQIAQNGDSGKHVVIKMDVEGAEWESLDAIPDDVLRLVDQLVVEFHLPGKRHHVDVIRKLKKTFHVANVHFNNCCCSDELPPLPSRMVEILFVNKGLAVADEAAFVPSPLDSPNLPHTPDCQAQWR